MRHLELADHGFVLCVSARVRLQPSRTLRVRVAGQAPLAARQRRTRRAGPLRRNRSRTRLGSSDHLGHVTAGVSDRPRPGRLTSPNAAAPGPTGPLSPFSRVIAPCRRTITPDGITKSPSRRRRLRPRPLPTRNVRRHLATPGHTRWAADAASHAIAPIRMPGRATRPRPWCTSGDRRRGHDDSAKANHAALCAPACANGVTSFSRLRPRGRSTRSQLVITAQ